MISRSPTHINAQLLRDTPIQVVASPTSGHDHMAIGYLKQHDIAYYTAPGCNAGAVADYVLACIAYATQQGILQGRRVGLVGLGHVGSKVAKRLDALGFTLLLNDPPRAARDPNFESVPFGEFHDLDILSLHTPLVTEGHWPSYHLIDNDILTRQKKGMLLINTARGDVLSKDAFIAHQHRLYSCLDVYPDEPHLDPRLLEHALLCTPHIAGYSMGAKWRGSYHICQALRQHFGLAAYAAPWSPPALHHLDLKLDHTWAHTILEHYDPSLATRSFKAQIQQHPSSIAKAFRVERTNTPLRPELILPIDTISSFLNPMP